MEVEESEINEIAEQLATEHWETYVKKIVEVHEPDPAVVEKVGVHYILAFIHGFKHGVEYHSSLPMSEDLDISGET